MNLIVDNASMGLGDHVQLATILYAYVLQGHSFNLNYPWSMRPIYQATGIGHCKNGTTLDWGYEATFNQGRSQENNKAGRLLNLPPLPGGLVWDSLPIPSPHVPKQLLVTLERRFEIVSIRDNLALICSQGTNFADKKNPPRKVIEGIYDELLAQQYRVMELDRDNRVAPYPGVERIRYRSVWELMGLLSLAKVFVGVDTGPLHLARWFPHLNVTFLEHEFLFEAVCLPAKWRIRHTLAEI